MQRSGFPLSGRTRRCKKAQAGKGASGWAVAGPAGEGAGDSTPEARKTGGAKQQGWELLEKECPASRVRCYQDLPPELMTWGIFKTQEKSRLRTTFPGCEGNPAATSVTPRITRVDLADVAG